MTIEQGNKTTTLLSILLILAAFASCEGPDPDESNIYPFFTGTEMGAATKYEYEDIFIDIINSIAKTKFVKIRFDQRMVDQEDCRALYGDQNECSSIAALDDIAAIAQREGWSIIPMISIGHLSITQSEDIEGVVSEYASFVHWFLSRYKDSFNVEFLELHNNPSHGFGQNISMSDAIQALLSAQKKVYALKEYFPDIQIGTPGFEFLGDVDSNDVSIQMPKAFLSEEMKGTYDFFAIHGYAFRDEQTKTYIAPIMESTCGYPGVKGFLKIRKELDGLGMQDVGIIDTENLGTNGGKTFGSGMIPDKVDNNSAIFLGQALTLKHGLTYNGKRVLNGIVSLKTLNRASDSDSGGADRNFGSLNNDATLTKEYTAMSIVQNELKGGEVVKHISGSFDSDQVWVDKYAISENEVTYSIFKPFTKIQDIETLPEIMEEFTITFDGVPSSITLEDIFGNSQELEPTKEITISANHVVQFVHIKF